MQKYLLVIAFVGFSSMALAANMTAITIGNVNAPVHAGVFRGMCSNLDLSKLKNPNDFPYIEGESCEFITSQTLHPKKTEVINTWHQGSVPLFLVAFQDGHRPIKCLIDDGDRMYITQAPKGLMCASSEDLGADDSESKATENNAMQDALDTNAKGQPIVAQPYDEDPMDDGSIGLS